MTHLEFGGDFEGVGDGLGSGVSDGGVEDLICVACVSEVDFCEVVELLGPLAEEGVFFLGTLHLWCV